MRLVTADPMETTIESADGTPLAASVSGDGPPIVLVHGSVDDRSAWTFVLPLLAEHHCVWTYDRRGRGASGDSTEHSLGREVEDVLAVVEAAGSGAHLVGHSFGAVCAVEAARTADNLASLALYEPPLHTDRVQNSIARVLRLIDAGQPDAALPVFLVGVAGLSDDEVALAQAVPHVWQRLVDAAAATLEREAAVLQALRWDPDRYRTIRTPVLFITGALTNVPTYLTHDDVVATLPHAAHATISGQGHLAAIGDPSAFAGTVLRFITTHT